MTTEPKIEEEEIQTQIMERFISFGEWWELYGDIEIEESLQDFRKAA
jgi:hypothetical protein